MEINWGEFFAIHYAVKNHLSNLRTKSLKFYLEFDDANAAKWCNEHTREPWNLNFSGIKLSIDQDNFKKLKFIKRFLQFYQFKCGQAASLVLKWIRHY